MMVHMEGCKIGVGYAVSSTALNSWEAASVGINRVRVSGAMQLFEAQRLSRPVQIGPL